MNPNVRLLSRAWNKNSTSQECTWQRNLFYPVINLESFILSTSHTFLDGTETGGILQGDVLSWLAYIATATKNRNMFPGWYRWCIDDVYLVFKAFTFFLVSMWVLLTQQTTGSPTIFFTWLFEWRSSIEEVIRVYEFGNDTNLNPINPYRSYSHISSYFPDPDGPDVGVISWGLIWKPTKGFRKMQLRVLGHFWILGCQFVWGLNLITCQFSGSKSEEKNWVTMLKPYLVGGLEHVFFHSMWGNPSH